jgi:hypothetical protein
MIPIIELRLAIPLGAGLGLAAWQTFCLAVIGNLLPVPLLLLLCRWLLSLMHRICWTRRFAAWLEKQQQVARRLVFVIGGPYGFSDDVYERANSKISLSKMTFSHQMVRLIFCEQLYRACTIIQGEPYHHE